MLRKNDCLLTLLDWIPRKLFCEQFEWTTTLNCSARTWVWHLADKAIILKLGVCLKGDGISPLPPPPPPPPTIYCPYVHVQFATHVARSPCRHVACC